MNHFLILIPQSLNSQFLNLAPIAIIMRIVSKKRTWFLDQITMSEFTRLKSDYSLHDFFSLTPVPFPKLPRLNGPTEFNLAGGAGRARRDH